MNIHVSTLLVTYNSAQTIKDCLLSLNAQTFKGFEVILVDNNSTDTTVQIIEFIKPQLYFPIKTLYLKENLGFAKGNNFALSYISQNCKYIALLNADARADNKWLQILVTEMENNLGIGICVPKILTWDSRHIDSAGVSMSTFIKGFNRGEGKEADQYNDKEYIFGACGCAAVYRKKLIDEIGFFDEDFFLIHEDVDLSFRAQLAGWRILYVPEAMVYHKVRSSIGKMSDKAVFYSLRNVELVKIKNLPLKLFAIHIIEIILGMVMEFFYFALKHKKLKIYLKSKIDVFKLFPKMLEKRRLNFKIKKMTDQYINTLFTPIFEKEFFTNKMRKFFAKEGCE